MPVSPTIQLTFRGILVMSFNEGEGVCEVGFLNEPPPNHILTIDFTRRTATGTAHIIHQINESNVRSRLRLDVENVSRPGVHRFTQLRFDRSRRLGDRQDFRWAVNYEELLGGEPEVNSGGFRSILDINNGTFFTEMQSEDELRFQPVGSDSPRVFGRVATAIGAQISLDRADSRAVFMNGDEQVFEYLPAPGVSYAINVSQSPPPRSFEVPTFPDANAYQAVFTPPQGRRQVEFLLPPPALNTPTVLDLPVSQHAVCFTAVTNQSLV
jgi:hypothetical protein